MNITGIIPAGGRASRISPLPCSKEIIPMGFRKTPDGTKKPKVVSHYLLEKYKKAGADRTFFILKPGKWDIPAYYLDGKMLEMPLAYLTMNLPYGVPYTIDKAYPFIKEDIVMLGFPDIIFKEKKAFKLKREALQSMGADIVLGLFPVLNQKQAQKCDMVEWDEKTNTIKLIDIKPNETPLNKSWLTACWNPTFTSFMHQFLKEDLSMRKLNPDLPELFMGHVIQAAMQSNLVVRGIFFDNENYIDIGTPDDFAKAQKGYLTDEF
ncbi:sugar phosphate nucleotidyltransferase [Chondrinema litorale]|uniref:sugar phosphate nucleotidyltransferase n=1 Tax=Chondrinema litorale TaxID=2994555 RepID=UPI002542B074|nr:sugar phosphate nucleotidyltransferase [Chondrinema litorale]UZR92346.1 sugar phosphate nucleotidyltransferase [Chondrinema litorale]